MEHENIDMAENVPVDNVLKENKLEDQMENASSMKESNENVTTIITDPSKNNNNNLTNENVIEEYQKVGYGLPTTTSNTDETKAKFGVLSRDLFKKYKALMPDQAIYSYKDKRDTINALYTMVNAKIEGADITRIVKRDQDVVNQSIETLNLALEKIEGYGQKIDISGLDFKKIEEEFLKAKENQNVAVQSLKDKVAKKLNRLVDQNPLRIDFYERYQQIIEDYNRGKEYRSIKEIWDELVVIFGDLSEEEQRAKRENLDEDELAVFDMLVSNKKISDKDRVKVKEVARELLRRLKKKEFMVSRWTEKIQTSAAVQKVVDDLLFLELPRPAYDGAISLKAELLFNVFRERFANYAA